jgi:hypothetical protein
VKGSFGRAIVVNNKGQDCAGYLDHLFSKRVLEEQIIKMLPPPLSASELTTIGRRCRAVKEDHLNM